MSSFILPTLGMLLQIRAWRGLSSTPSQVMLISNSIENACFKVLRGFGDRPSGYVIWANVNDESLTLFLETGQYPTYLYEWNEGTIALIIDVVILPEFQLDAWIDLKKQLRNFSQVAYKRKGKVNYISGSSGKVLKIIKFLN